MPYDVADAEFFFLVWNQYIWTSVSINYRLFLALWYSSIVSGRFCLVREYVGSNACKLSILIPELYI